MKNIRLSTRRYIYILNSTSMDESSKKGCQSFVPFFIGRGDPPTTRQPCAARMALPHMKLLLCNHTGSESSQIVMFVSYGSQSCGYIGAKLTQKSMSPSPEAQFLNKYMSDGHFKCFINLKNIITSLNFCCKIVIAHCLRAGYSAWRWFQDINTLPENHSSIKVYFSWNRQHGYRRLKTHRQRNSHWNHRHRPECMPNRFRT